MWKRNRMNQVTVEEARKILGNEAVGMSDDELQGLIDNLSAIAKWALEEAINNRLGSTNES